jgi:hypothetical protein
MKSTKYYLNWATVFFLTLGATVWLGLMSFSGMYVLWPSLGLAMTSLILSVLYEGEIFKKNIQKALDKLFNPHLFHEKLATEVIEELLKENHLIVQSQFLTAYQQALNSHDHKRQQIMKRWLGQLLIQTKPIEALRPLEIETLKLINSHLNLNHEQRFQQLRYRHRWLIAFSALASVLSMVCTNYLIMEALQVIPFISISAVTLPYVVIPVAIISGIAYGFLTYNSCSDFLLDNSITTWWNNFSNLFRQGFTLDAKRFSYLIFSGLILLLNLSLTICTAGTWWTLISEHSKGNLNSLKFLSPLILGLSALSFNLKNTIDTVKELEPTVENPAAIEQPQANESFWQSANPFRWLLAITYKPLEKLLFLGHLISIGVTGDRMPGVSPALSTILGTVSEGFEDVHYFFPLNSEEYHDHDHDHEHSNLPTLALKICFSPLFLLAAIWQAYSSNQSIRLSLNQMLEQDNHHHHEDDERQLTTCKQWLIEESLITIEEQHQRLETCTQNMILVSEKKDVLLNIKNILEEIAKKESRKSSDLFEPIIEEDHADSKTLKSLYNHPCLNQHRFWQSSENTETRQALDEIRPLIQAI